MVARGDGHCRQGFGLVDEPGRDQERRIERPTGASGMRLSRLLAGSESTPFGLPNFDSTTVFVRAAARALGGREFPGLGMIPGPLRPLAAQVNCLPPRARTAIYSWGGANEGVDPDELTDVDVEAFRQWVTDRYPDRGYPAVLVGSSNGAAVYLAALLGIPFLPQTFLVPVRRSLGPDEIRADVAWGRATAPGLLSANPDVAVHQMHDPNQDRLMVRKLGYFRTKSRRLGEAYETFLETVLEPGGTVILLDCGYEWPAIDLGPNHSFQLGGLGGLSPQEYYEGSNDVARFLAAHDASVRRWDVLEPDGLGPEAEWGFEPALGEDVARFADEHGYEIRRLAFDDPRDLSPFVADRYRDRYAESGQERDRLFVQSFALVEPWWTMRTGSVPFWTAFNTEPDLEHVTSYLDEVPTYDEIWATLFAHGVESAGLAGPDQWRELLKRARRRGGFVGVDEDAFPYDVETQVRYHRDLPSTVDAREPLPSPVPFDRFDAVADEVAADYEIEWERPATVEGGPRWIHHE